MAFYREILNECLARKKKSNPKYSLRSFAKFLEISHSQLSMILSERRGLSYKAAIKISEKLDLNGVERKLFKLSALAESARSTKIKEEAKQQIEKIKAGNNLDTLLGEDFKIISEWQYFAILELINTKNFRHNTLWIANRLGLDENTVRESIQRLKYQGMIKIEDNKFYGTDKSFTTTNEIPSQTIRNYHKSIIAKAGASVDNQTLENRDLAALTIGISKNKLPEFKSLIRSFRRELNQLAENIPEKERDAVYMFSSQFFELTH